MRIYLSRVCGEPDCSGPRIGWTASAFRRFALRSLCFLVPLGGMLKDLLSEDFQWRPDFIPAPDWLRSAISACRRAVLIAQPFLPSVCFAHGVLSHRITVLFESACTDFQADCVLPHLLRCYNGKLIAMPDSPPKSTII